MGIDELKVYNLSMELGEKARNVVTLWNYFAKDTIGKQLVRPADSIAANLSEGFGRYHYKEKKNFSYYSRRSLFETKTLITKAHTRNLLLKEDFDYFHTGIEFIDKMLNSYIKSIGNIPTDAPEGIRKQ